MKKEGWLFGTLKKEDGKLVHVNSGEKAKYTEFVKALEEGQSVEFFFDANVDDATLARIAKVHKCIRELAKKSGYSFDDMKFKIKKAAGMCISKKIDGELVMVCKSFADCSREDVDLAIHAAVELGDTIQLNLR